LPPSQRLSNLFAHFFSSHQPIIQPGAKLK
jgi:hypothetical protein